MNAAAQRTGERALHGVLAGLVGTAALSAFERLEQALLGRSPVYAARVVGVALVSQTGIACSKACGHRTGLMLRWLYGPALGVLYAAVMQSRKPVTRWSGPRTLLGSALCFSSAIGLFELVAMPAAKATKPVREWTWAELALLFCHTSAFAMATVVTNDYALQRVRLRIDSPRHPAPAGQ